MQFPPQVVVNLYPFRATVTAATAPTFDVAVENIDIGTLRDGHVARETRLESADLNSSPSQIEEKSQTGAWAAARVPGVVDW